MRALRVLRPMQLAVLVPAMLLVIASSTSCRKSAPDENVYTGTGTKNPGEKAPPAGSSGGPTASGDFDKLALLRAFSDCALDRFRDFDRQAGALRDAARAHAAARSDLTAPPLREAWLSAMRSWEQAELFRIGPSANSTLPGGADLRDQIDAWPLVSRCKIEEQIVSHAYAGPGFATSLVNARGLAAIEYLVFYGGVDNACSSVSTINAGGAWAALAPQDLAQRKADYARAAAEDVAARASALVLAWEPKGGNFHGELSTAGAGSKIYKSDRDALNGVTTALFYLEKEVKDWKLGRPLGFDECTKARCPESVESPFARVSTAHIRANIAGFRRAFEGCGDNGAGIGFDDWLRAVGAGDTANRMLSALAAVSAGIDALDPPLEQALETNAAGVEAFYTVMKTLTTLLKTELITILDLELPKTSEGDND